MAAVARDTLFDVEKTVAVVTGGGTGQFSAFRIFVIGVVTYVSIGIGFMMAKALALNGATKVYIVGRRKEKLEAAAKISPHNVIPIVGDVTSKDSLCNVAQQVQADAGCVNLLCCNSGVMSDPIKANSSKASVAEFAKAAMECDPDNWNRTFMTNFTATAFTAFAFLELLDAGNRKRGDTGAQSQILITSSVAAYVRAALSNIPYGGSKAATNLMVKQLSTMLVPYNIRVNAFAPGLFPSDISTNLVAAGGEPDGDPGVEGAYKQSFIPAQRLGTQEDISGLLLFLASRAGGYFNGSVLLNDGGRTTIMQASY